MPQSPFSEVAIFPGEQISIVWRYLIILGDCQTLPWRLATLDSILPCLQVASVNQQDFLLYLSLPLSQFLVGSKFSSEAPSPPMMWFQSVQGNGSTWGHNSQVLLPDCIRAVEKHHIQYGPQYRVYTPNVLIKHHYK